MFIFTSLDSQNYVQLHITEFCKTLNVIFCTIHKTIVIIDNLKIFNIYVFFNFDMSHIFLVIHSVPHNSNF